MHEMALLNGILQMIQEDAVKNGIIKIVVERRSADGVYINTTGIGAIVLLGEETGIERGGVSC